MNIIYREVKENEVEKIKNKYKEYINDNNNLHFGIGSLTLGAFIDDEPIGVISTYAKNLTGILNQKVDAYIDVLIVDEEYRRQGIARKMIKFTEYWAKKYGYRQIRTFNKEEEKAAIEMWYFMSYCMNPALEYETNKPGYYVTKMLNVPDID